MLERASCPNFSEFFPSGLSHPEFTLRNSTFIHSGSPPEAPRPWHSALGVKRAKEARKAGRAIYGTGVQFRCGFAASQHSDGQADIDRSASAKALSPEKYEAVDTTSVHANDITVTSLDVSFIADSVLIARNRSMSQLVVRESALTFVGLKISH